MAGVTVLRGDELGAAILSALGIPIEGVRRVTVDCTVDEVAVVTIERYAAAGKEIADLVGGAQVEIREVEVEAP